MRRRPRQFKGTVLVLAALMLGGYAAQQCGTAPKDTALGGTTRQETAPEYTAATTPRYTALGGAAPQYTAPEYTAATTQQRASLSAPQSSAAVLPNPALHPGATNPNVTQSNIGSTICTKGYTKTIRPPESYTSPLKSKQIAAEGLTGKPSDYEEDHLISLELGGNPTDPANLWPEPWESKGARLAAPGTGAESKDKVENRLHGEVCAGSLSLAEAQKEIASNWSTAA